MKIGFSRVLLFCFACIAFFACKKKEQFYYTTLGTTPEKVLISDIDVVNDSTFFVMGTDKEDRSVVYLCRENGQNKWSFSKQAKLRDKYADIVFDNGTTWLCGDDMFLCKSIDTAKSVARYTKFSYWNEWPSEKTHLRKLYVKDGLPYYMIGSDDLLSGSFYTYQNNDTIYKGSKKHFGLNDMVVCNDDVYVAGYGSILYVTDNGNTESFEDIGGENFTQICQAGSYLFACSYSGNIYRSDVGTHSWEKVASMGKDLLFIEANSLGDVIVAGESKTMLVSTNYGTEWREEKYSDGNKISCLFEHDNTFYIGTEKGVVLKITHSELAINGK